MQMSMRKLTAGDISQAAGLLAIRHRHERRVFQSLNKIFEEETLLEEIVAKKLEEKWTISVGAFSGSRLLGFIISNVKTDKVFGRSAWVAYDGLALADGVDVSLYRQLYAEIADQWLEAGCLKHFVIAPAGHKEGLDAWLHSGFAYEQVFGIQALKPLEFQTAENIVIRTAEAKDRKDLESISGLILSYQASSPVFAAALPEMFAEIEAGYGGLIEDDEAHVLLAYEGEKFLGFTCGYFEGENKRIMMVPYKSMELGVAGTNHSTQNKGIGTLLTQVLFRDAIKAGYENTTTDWRITNLKSSVFWPKMGYKPYAYRLVRTIDPRCYWANGQNRL